MRPTRISKAVVILTLLLVLAVAQGGLTAPLQQDPIWIVTYPTDGTPVSGVVTIQGTATHSTFVSYGVLYATGPTPTGDSQWVPIVFGVQSMVVNGPLATWDTTTLPNGQYTLALAVYEVGNDTPNLHFVNNINVHNEAVTPTPTPTATPEATTEPEGQPTPAADVIVPTIEQPPTATPRPTATFAADAPPSEGETNGAAGSSFSLAGIGEAFSAGVWIAILLYLTGGLYVAGRAVLRYYLRQQKSGPKTP